MIGRGKGDGEVPIGLFAFVCTRDKTDIQMSNAHNLDGLKYRWSGLPDPLLASKWIQLLGSLLVGILLHDIISITSKFMPPSYFSVFLNFAFVWVLLRCRSLLKNAFK